jgi:peptidoglycan/LPS O-acetylase OafA/YrhL
VSADAKLGFRADIEGLRALAVGLVIAAHVPQAWLPGGFIGVDVFFVISGYLMTGLLSEEQRSTGAIDIVGFYARRLRRLLPALLFMLAVTGSLAWLLLTPTEQREHARAALSVPLWLSNLHFALAEQNYFSPDASSNLFLHTWSLGVEEQFYLFWPLLLSALAGRQLARWLVVVAIVSLVACLVVATFAAHHAFYQMPLRAWQFAVGGLVYLLLRGRTISVKVAEFLGWTALLVLSMGALWILPTLRYPSALALLPTLATAVLLAVVPSTRALARALGGTLPQWLGKRSYALYLWHWPVLLLVPTVAPPGHLSTALALFLTVGIATLSERLIERPMRAHRGLILRPRLTAGLGLIAMAFALAGIVFWLHVIEPAERTAVSRRVMGAIPSLYYTRPRFDEWHSGDALYPIEYPAAAGAPTVYYIGDSVGSQWLSAVIPAYQAAGWRVVALTKSACPLFGRPYFYPRIGRMFDECDRWRTNVASEIAKTQPQRLLVGMSANYPLTPDQWEQGAAQFLDRAKAQAIEVLVITPTPTLSPSTFAASARAIWRPDWLAFTVRADESLDSTRASAVTDSLLRGARRVTRAALVDFTDLLCPRQRCRADEGERPIFRDTQHVHDRWVRMHAAEIGERALGEPKR